MPSLQKLFHDLDLYRYRRLFEDDCYTHTWHSYTFTFVAVFTIVFLLTGEITGHFKGHVETDLFVDEYLENELMAIDFDITFERVPCHFIDISVSDVTGGLAHNITKNIVRTRLDYKGRELGQQDEAATVDADELKDEVFQKEEDEYEKILSDGSFTPDGHVEELHERKGMLEFIQAHKKPHELVFIDFYAPWCIWCQRLEPVLAKLGHELGTQGPIYVGRIDCTKRENEQACVSQHVHSFPTMMFYRHGDEHPFEAYHGERTVEAMKKRCVEIARGDPQSAADAKKAELHRLDGNRGAPVGLEQCRIQGNALVHQVPSQMRFQLSSARHTMVAERLNNTHKVKSISFSLDTANLDTPTARDRSLLAHISTLMSRPLTGDFLGQDFVSEHVNQTFTHYMKLTPMENREGDSAIETFMFSHYGNEHVDQDYASVVFNIDLSAVGIRNTKTYKPFYALVTRLLAVIGGAFSVINVARGFTAEVVKITMGKQD